MTTDQLRKPPTLTDVARAAGVSKTTASHALNGKGWVAAETREAVRRVAAELGFEADLLAQRLSSGRCPNTVAFFSLDIDLSSRTRLMQLIQASLNDLGYNVPIYAYGYRGCHDESNQLTVMRAMLASRPGAVVCNISSVLPPVLARLKQFQEEGGIVVCYGYGKPAELPCDQVLFDAAHSAYLAAQHLLELGHRDLGVFHVGERKPTGERLKGFKRALDEYGVEINDEWLFPNEGILRYEEEGVLLAQRFMSLQERPTGMCMANDYAATGFVSTLMAAGIHVPQEVSVVGDNNDPIAPLGMVPLTTVTQPYEELERHVVVLLHERLQGTYSRGPRQIMVRGELIVRASTGAQDESITPSPAHLHQDLHRPAQPIDGQGWRPQNKTRLKAK